VTCRAGRSLASSALRIFIRGEWECAREWAGCAVRYISTPLAEYVNRRKSMLHTIEEHSLVFVQPRAANQTSDLNRQEMRISPRVRGETRPCRYV
jgi:hypothetical protein